MEDVIENVLEMVKLKLEVAQIALNTLAKLDFTQQSVKDASFVANCRHKAADLTEDS